MKDYSKRYYWIKIKESFMTSDTVDFLISQDGCNGFKYVVLYQLLCLKTANSNGRLIRQLGEVLVPYDVTKIHREFSKWYKLDEIKKAFELFNELGLIRENDEGIIAIANFENMVGSETYDAIRKRENRLLPKLVNGSRRLNAESVLLVTGKTQYVDEKRYGGNGMFVLDRAKGKCEVCGSKENILIHHANGNSNEANDLIVLCSKCHGYVHSNNNRVVEIVQHIVQTRIKESNTKKIEILDIRDKRLDIRDIDKDIDIKESSDDDKKKLKEKYNDINF